MQLPGPGELAGDIVAMEAPISRRTFFRGAAALIAGVCVAKELVADDQPASNEAEPAKDTQSSEESKWDYGDSAKMGMKSLAAETATVLGLGAVGLNVGNAGIGIIYEGLRTRPISTGIDMVAMFPILEEATFRLAPSAIADTLNPSGKGNRRWALGVAASATFAAVHNMNSKGSRVLPIPQFVGGLFDWYVQRRAGYKYAVASHSIHNAALLPILWGMSRGQDGSKKKAEDTDQD